MMNIIILLVKLNFSKFSKVTEKADKDKTEKSTNFEVFSPAKSSMILGSGILVK